MPKWTALMDKMLIKLCEADAPPSNSMIAALLNDVFATELTRNAIIGRRHRLDLKCNRKNPSQAPGFRKKRILQPPHAAKSDSMLEKLLSVQLKMEKAVTVKALEKESPQLGGLGPLYLTFDELQNNSCRYPYGDSNYRFCGHQVEEGSSYCIHHNRLCHDGKQRDPVYVPDRLLGKRAA